MCLITIQERPTKAVIDIFGYKWVVENDDPNFWIAPYRGVTLPYNVPIIAELENHGETPHLEIIPEDELFSVFRTDGTVYGAVNNGFHSYKNERAANGSLLSRCYRAFLRRCVIPKGSEYCDGTYGDIVSTHIIVFSSDEEFEKYKSEHQDIK